MDWERLKLNPEDRSGQSDTNGQLHCSSRADLFSKGFECGIFKSSW